KCPKHQKLQANALVVNDLDVSLSNEVLNQLDIEDSLAEEFCTLSLNALSGTEIGHCMKLRALVNCTLQEVPPSRVKLANAVPDLEWWCQGHTFKTPMKVLPLGSYDAILGFDWLEQQSHGLSKINAKQLIKWSEGNDIWAYVMVHTAAIDDPSPNSSEISQFLVEYADVFEVPTTLPPHHHYDHTIPILPGVAPVISRPYHYSPLHKYEIGRQIKVLLEQGYIVHSKKKDGTWRICVDYRCLNAITVKNRFPIPLVEEILDELVGSTHFTKLDLTTSYHQVRMMPQDEHKTVFKTHHGHYHFKCLRNDILSPFLRKFVMVFMDDILVYSPSLSQHIVHLTSVLQQLRQHKFFLKKVKCSFAQQQIEYLGHIISCEGVATDLSKIETKQKWPTPTSITELKGFLGLTEYYRRFIKGYDVIARPLNMLLKKNAFQWSVAAEQAFLALKQAIQQPHVLALPNFQQTFIIEIDACALGIGTVLMQQERPIAYLSKALGMKLQQLSIYEKEFLALIMAVGKWRSYLQWTEFIILIDHRCLAYLSEQNLHSDLQRKAMARLMGLRFKVVYKKGKENLAADALSQVAHLLAIQAVSVKLLATLAISSPDSNGYELVDGIIKRQGLIWVGQNSALETKIIAAMHSSPVGGHFGSKATYYRIKKLFGWKGLRADVDDFVK
ncbi:hypothetical protein U9M48_039527, partial [Paspalum notatum var. saurae]